MTEQDHSVRVVSRREAMAGTGVALGSLVASGGLTETVLAQSGGPSDEISGTVEDESGAVEGATVVAVPHDTSLAALETTTAADGSYIFAQSDLHEDTNLYHVIARDGIESDPRRGVPNYPFIAAEGPPGIPDSAVRNWDPSTFTTGDSVWTDEVANADMSITGDPQSSTFSDGSDAITADGTDDYGSAAWPTQLDGSGMQSWAIEFEIQYSTNDPGSRIVGNIESDGQRLLIDQDKDENNNDNNGNFRFTLQDTNANVLRFSPTSSPGLDDGVKHKVSISVSDASQNNYSVYIDGSSVSTTASSTDGPSSFDAWGSPLGFWALLVTGSPQDYFNGSLGLTRLHDTSITGQTI